MSAVRSVIVIDDHHSLRRNLVALLQDEGFVVFDAADGESALALLADQDCDVAIVDIRLPGMNGYELLPCLHARYPEMTLLIHTGSVDFLLTPELSALGIAEDDIFFKPIADTEQFVRRIQRAGDSS